MLSLVSRGVSAEPLPYRVVAVPGQELAGAGPIGAPLASTISDGGDVLVSSSNDGGSSMIAIEQGGVLQQIFADDTGGPFIALPSLDGALACGLEEYGVVTWADGVVSDRITAADISALDGGGGWRIVGAGADLAGGVILTTTHGTYYRGPGAGSPVVKMAQLGDEVPGRPGRTLGMPQGCGGQIAGDGTVVMCFALLGEVGSVLLYGKAGAVTTVAMTDEPAEEGASVWQDGGAVLSRDTAYLATIATVADATTGEETTKLFTGPGGALEAMPGVVWPLEIDGDTYSPSSLVTAGAREVALQALGLSGETAIIAGDAASGLEVVARTNRGPVGTALGAIQINANGDVVFDGLDAAGHGAIFLKKSGDSVVSVAAEGDSFDLGGSIGTVVATSVDGIFGSRRLNNEGDVSYVIGYDSAEGPRSAALATGQMVDGPRPDLRVFTSNVTDTTDITTSLCSSVGFDLTVQNNGTVMARNITVTTDNPDFVLSSAAACTGSVQSVCDVAELAPGEEFTLGWSTTVDETGSFGVASDVADPTPDDNVVTFTAELECSSGKKKDNCSVAGKAGAAGGAGGALPFVVLAGVALLRRRRAQS